jgi:hypothetical protein
MGGVLSAVAGIVVGVRLPLKILGGCHVGSFQKETECQNCQQCRKLHGGSIPGFNTRCRDSARCAAEVQTGKTNKIVRAWRSPVLVNSQGGAVSGVACQPIGVRLADHDHVR